MGNNWEGQTVPANGAGNVPDVSQIETLIGFSNFVQENFLLNDDMEIWNAGASAAPDSWTLTGSGASVSRQTGSKFGSYAARVTCASADAYLSQNYASYADMVGRLVIAWVWVKTSTANGAKLRISDGVSTADSSFHTGDGTWQLLQVQYTVQNGATKLSLELHMIAAGFADFDEAVLCDFQSSRGRVRRWAKLTADNGAGSFYSSSGKIHLGGTNPGGQLEVDAGSAGTIAAILKGAASPTADLLELQNSSGQILAGFDKAGNLMANTVNYSSDGGSANAYTATLSPAPVAYATGMTVAFKAANANTGASTINVNGLGAKNLKVFCGGGKVPLPANFIVTGSVIFAFYDGTDFVVLTPTNLFGIEQVAAPSAASSVAFTGLTAGGLYRATWVLKWNTSAGQMLLRFNNDSGSNYARADYADGSSTGAGGSGSTSTTSFQAVNGADTVDVGGVSSGSILFSAFPGALTKAAASGHAYYYSTPNNCVALILGGYYSGGANITELDFIASAGTFTGVIRLERLN